MIYFQIMETVKIQKDVFAAGVTEGYARRYTRTSLMQGDVIR